MLRFQTQPPSFFLSSFSFSLSLHHCPHTRTHTPPPPSVRPAAGPFGALVCGGWVDWWVVDGGAGRRCRHSEQHAWGDNNSSSGRPADASSIGNSAFTVSVAFSFHLPFSFLSLSGKFKPSVLLGMNSQKRFVSKQKKGHFSSPATLNAATDIVSKLLLCPLNCTEQLNVEWTYGAAGEYSPPAGMTGENGVAEQGFTQQQHRSQAHKRPPLCGPTVETMKSPDPRLMDLVNGELLDCSPALGWGELAGLTHVKTALEEDLLWPVLRPSPMVRPPKTVLLFGPRGGGKTTLARSLASQLGASFYRLSGAMLASKGKAESEHILGSLLQAAGARQPSVVLLSQVEAMEEEGLRQTLLNTLEKAQVGTTGLVILVCATGRPDLLQDAVHRSFAKRYHVGLPDAAMRRQVLLQALSPQGFSLSERELSAVLQRTEGFSVWELLQLSQQALSSAASPTGAMHTLPTSSKPPAFTDFENAFCKVCPHTTTKELDTCIEWNKMYSH
uniref:Fidgetin like 2 n=1 Tax=Echeneis naucrates TaxID=173247 RepID=A0A665VRK7_ECHNA